MQCAAGHESNELMQDAKGVTALHPTPSYSTAPPRLPSVTDPLKKLEVCRTSKDRHLFSSRAPFEQRLFVEILDFGPRLFLSL